MSPAEEQLLRIMAPAGPPPRKRRRGSNRSGVPMAQVDYDLVLRHARALKDHERTILYATTVYPGYAAIAEDLRLPVGTVKSRLFRARHALRIAVEAEAKRLRRQGDIG